MSFDDELKSRLKQAAEQAGQHADPTKAAARLSTITSSTALTTATTLKVVGGLAALGLLTGAVIGATSLRSEASVSSATGVDVQAGRTFDCPDGSAVGSLQPGDRVYVIGRDDAGGWVAVRDPGAVGRTVWIPASSLRPDDEPTEVPVVECDDTTTSVTAVEPEVTADSVLEETDTTIADPTTSTTSTTTRPSNGPTTPAPGGNSPSPTTTAAPSSPPPPTAAPDNQPPTIQGSASESEIYDASWSANCADRSTITFTVADNVGVVSVTATRNGPPGPAVSMTNIGGGKWRTTLGPFTGLPGNFNQLVNVTATAMDAAGNSTAATVSVRVWGTCLI